MKLKQTRSLVMTALLMVMTTPVLADNPSVNNDSLAIDSAYLKAQAHRENVRVLSEQVEIMTMKKELAEIIYSCRQKGVICKPSLDKSSDLGVEYVGTDDVSETQSAGGGIGVPEGVSGGLKSVTLMPGDEGYEPLVETGYDSASQSVGGYADTPPMYEPVAETYTENLNPQDAGLIDVDSFQPIEGFQPDVVTEDFTTDTDVSGMPELLGVENEFAVFSVNGRDVRVKGGQKIPDSQWKVRSVEFNSVLMQDPNGDSDRVYLSWK